MGVRQNDSAVATLLAAASTEKGTPAQLRSRRHAVAAARDAPEAAAERLDMVCGIYFAEIERPVSVADEFARIDDYSTDIREACAEVFVAVADTDAQRFADAQSNLLQALRVEQVEPIRETLVETAGSLVEQGVIVDSDHRDLIDVLCEVGKTTDETGTGSAVAAVLGTYADPAFDEAVQRHAATALESIAKHQRVDVAVATLRELGRIGVENGYDGPSMTAVEQLTAVVDEHMATGEGGAEQLQHVRESFLTAVEGNDWDAVESTYLLETALEAGPVLDTEMMGPILEAGVDIDDEKRLRELMEFASDAAFDLGTMARFAAVTELETIGVETASTVVRREILSALDRMVQTTDNLHLRLVATLGIGDVGECIEDAALRRDAVTMLERALETDEYLARSAAADALSDVAASGTSMSLLSRVLDVLRAEFTAADPEPLHSARAPILEIGIRTDDPDVQAMVLGLVRSLVSRDRDGAVEIIKDGPKLLDALDPRLALEAVAVVRAAVWNDYHHVSASGVNAISGAWLAAQQTEVQESVRRMLFYAALNGDAKPVTKQKVLQTCLDFVDEGGDSQLLLPVLGYLAADDHDLVQVFSMAALARLETDRADAILGSFVEDDETAVNLGVAWGRGDLPVEPPSAATDHEDVMKAMNTAVAPDRARTEQVVLSELRFLSTPGIDMSLSPDDDLDVVVGHVLTSGSLQFRRETVDLVEEHADGLRIPLRRRLVETLRLGMTDENGSVGSATADAVARLCVTTDDRQTWERGIEVLRTGAADDRNNVVGGAAEALAEMAASASADAPVQHLREALSTAIVNGNRIAAVAAVEGIAEIGTGAADLSRVLSSTPDSRPVLEKASRDNELSDREQSVAIDLAANTGAITSISAPSAEE